MKNLKSKKIVYLFTIILIFVIILFSGYTKINKKIEVESFPSENILPLIGPEAPSEKSYVSLVVLDKKYETEIKEGDTVYDAMNKLQSNIENNFTFQYKEYLALGIFVEEINGVKGSPGKYWMYYVNDVEAEAGISKFKVKDGDIINWKQE